MDPGQDGRETILVAAESAKEGGPHANMALLGFDDGCSYIELIVPLQLGSVDSSSG